MEEYYKILWIKKWASKDEIKKAYRKMSMKYHPDKWWNDYMFTLIRQAYDKIKDVKEYKTNTNQRRKEIIEIKTRVKTSQFWKTIKVKWYKLELPFLVKKWDVFWEKDNVKVIILEIIIEKKSKKDNQEKSRDKQNDNIEDKTFWERFKEMYEKWVTRLIYNLGVPFLAFLMINIQETFFTSLGMIWIIFLIVLRFKNLWRSGWYTLWFFVPIYKLYLFFLLIFVEKSEVEEKGVFIKIIIGIFVITLLAILWTIAFISLQWLNKGNEYTNVNKVEDISYNSNLNLGDGENINEESDSEKYEQCLNNWTPSICLGNYGFSENYIWNITEFYKFNNIKHTVYIKENKILYFTSEVERINEEYITKVNVIYPEKLWITEILD